MILSDRSIRDEIAAGRIEVDPFDASMVQPSSIDVRLDRYFRVFLNHTTAVIDVKENLEELTQLVEIPADEDAAAFILHPGEFVLGATLERVHLPDDMVARIEGKALAVDTWIPTPAGWARMGDLEVGDLVYHPSGRPTTVVAASPVMEDRPCAEVTFAGGEVIVADREHQWQVMTRGDRRYGRRRVVTTAEIERTLVPGHEHHHVALPAPIEYPSRDLPVDPYVLGAWIGDGTSTKAELTCTDEPILQAVGAGGGAVTKAPRRPADSLSGRRCDLDLLGHEVIPEDYMVASVEQRRALLEGLMENGTADTTGRCQLTTARAHLAYQYRELIASLGFRPQVTLGSALFDGRSLSVAYHVCFTPDRPVLRHDRKLARPKVTGRFEGTRGIRSVTEIEPEPVRCIQVAAPDGMFLASRSYIPTHNSSLGRLGLLIHSTAGFIDPGFDGHITLELSNVANLPITLYPGMKVGQISFHRMTTPADEPYGSSKLGSKYQGQRGPTPSRYWENFTNPRQ